MYMRAHTHTHTHTQIDSLIADGTLEQSAKYLKFKPKKYTPGQAAQMKAERCKKYNNNNKNGVAGCTNAGREV
jgi:hypothetical protein